MRHGLWPLWLYQQVCMNIVSTIQTLLYLSDNRVVLEVNRFDPGKWIREKGCMKLHPTIVLPGDIPIHSKVRECHVMSCDILFPGY